MKKRKSGQTYDDATSSSLYLDRIGNENEWEPEYLRKISDYYKKMGLIREAPLDSFLYKDLTSTLYSSGFWLYDNEDLGWKGTTDAALELKRALEKFFKNYNMHVGVKMFSVDERNGASLQSDENPNHFLVGAEAEMSTRSKGHIVLLVAIAEEDFNSGLIDPKAIVEDVAIKIRHELVHLRQYASLARDKGISKYRAKKKYEEWGDIPEEGEDETAYLGSRIEVDAFGHEFAERLAQKFGLKKAQQMVATKSDTSVLQGLADDIDFGTNFKQYFGQYPKAEFADRVRSKIKKYLRRFGEQGIYESKTEKVVKITRSQLKTIIREAMESGPGPNDYAYQEGWDDALWFGAPEQAEAVGPEPVPDAYWDGFYDGLDHIEASKTTP